MGKIKGKPHYTKEEIYNMLSVYATNYSLAETSRILDIPKSSLHEIIRKYETTPEFEQIRIEKGERFVKASNRIIDKMNKLLEKEVNRAMEDTEKIDQAIEILTNTACKDNDFNREEISQLKKVRTHTLNEITTSMGTLIDKNRLVQGESTENQELKITMSKELEDLSK